LGLKGSISISQQNSDSGTRIAGNSQILDAITVEITDSDGRRADRERV
jgi:hypothetical protein